MFDRRQLLASTAALAVAGHAPLALAAGKPPIKIGASLAMTGIGSVYGILYNAALKLAVDDVNAAGGVNGSMLTLSTTDDQMQPAMSVMCLREAVNEGCMVALGPLTGTCWETIAPLANNLKMPSICFTASKAGISKPPYALRIAPPDDTAIPEGVAEFVKMPPNVKKIAIAGDAQEASGAAGMELFAKMAKEFGLEVVTTAAYQTRTSDFSPDAIKIRGANPDAIFVSSLGPTSLSLVKELEVQGFDKPILLNSLVWAGAGFIHAVGSAGKNVYTIGFSTNDPDPANPKYNDYVKRFLESTKTTTNLPQPVNVCNTTLPYDTVFLVADIMRKAGIDGTTPAEKGRAAITDALAALKDYQGINKITLRDTGDGHIKCHLLKANAQTKQWEYALAPDQRIKTPAAFKARG